MLEAIALLSGAALASGPSPLPLITRLQHEHDNLAPTHPQRYEHDGADGGRLRRLVAQGDGTLTRENTRPLRLRTNYDSLYEDKAPAYSACFQNDAWFRRGLPTVQAKDEIGGGPTDGQETCLRGEGESASAQNGCWGKCLPGDLITPSARAKLIAVVDLLAADVSSYLAVPPTANLSFTVSKGAYYRALVAKGYTPTESCAADCKTLSGVAVDDGYCNGGLAWGRDVVLSVTKPPGVAGVAGTGSSCASDQSGRPLWIVLAWHKSLSSIESKTDAAAAEVERGFVLHEVLHGLGFVNSMFNYARDSAGQRKRLIELRPVTDNDGATDEVWFFTKGRAYEVAQHYFNCFSNSTGAEREWDGLPLMGLPDAGRGAHWETRIMRDDVMSYGFQPHVSSITLAAMEDLGFYLANYSHAECMSWGLLQGCSYVRTRCGTGFNDRSATISPANPNLCRGDPFWPTHPNSYLTQKCDGGNSPCSSASENGYALITGGASCNAQCHYGADVVREQCNTAPKSAVGSANTNVFDDLKNSLSTIDWQAWLIPLIWVLAFLVLISIVRRCVCPVNDNACIRPRTWSYALTLLVGALALGLLAVAILLFVERDTYQAFVGLPTVIASGVLAICLLLFTAAMLYGLAKPSPCLLRIGFWLLLLLTIVEILLSLLVIYWVYSLGLVPSDTLDSLFGSARSHIDGFLSTILDQPVAVAEGIVCKTYQTCCWSPALALMQHEVSSGTIDGGLDGGAEDGSGFYATNGTVVNTNTVPPTISNRTTCLTPADHTGGFDLELTLRDPSTTNFCPYTSGAPANLLVAPPLGTCTLIENLMGGFSLAECRANFCEAGTDGYLAFMTTFVQLLQKYGWPIAAGFATLVILQLILAFNLRRCAIIAHDQSQVKKETNYVRGTMMAAVSERV